ncbi:DUF4184 family protein [Flavobacterium sp. JLP]|uniref:DUF4184 family protein n=1 Tax=Flavobacterium sp. JLP TaxID=2783793 RepID=UPI00188B5F5F|nr:DUF4184 family protein [Flavobacterium sp. JLP]MBF4507049.1 DUF4184 family protein [Flavobacterium sp. JLP]
MPFTFSHPAIILPLQYLPRKWFSLTGLIIGSLTPDFEYFLRMKVQSVYSHTLSGIFWFDLPLAIALAFIFHNLIRDDLFNNFPIGIESRILIFTKFNWNKYFKENWLIVLISILIGITSHIFWDAFTHNHGYFVNHLSELRYTFNFFGNQIPIWKTIQHSSTFIGGIIITVAFFKLPKKNLSQSCINIKYWIAIIILTIVISAIRFYISFNVKAYGNIIVSVLSAFMISLILIPFIIKSKVNPKI